MRVASILLALGAIIWVMVQALGSNQSVTAIHPAHTQAMQKAVELEESIAVDAAKRLEELDKQ